jgi:hypothetical protein
LRDVGIGLGEASVARAFEEGVDALADNIRRWDTGSWSRYDLFPHPVMNVASFAYHTFHITLLQATHLLSPRPELQSAAARFEQYADSDLLCARAFARKALFRMAKPRSRRLATVLPWARA